MKQAFESVDMVSIKLNGVCLLGFITPSSLIQYFAAVATFSTIVYNAIRIYKEMKNK